MHKPSQTVEKKKTDQKRKNTKKRRKQGLGVEPKSYTWL
jgi:hypothetical protein